MNEATTTTCLAIAEKKSHSRPGGCVGIFFQLFDWNRRLLAKKKLFTRKLLPPARSTKQTTKKFGGDDKMPKTKSHLIADENSGGFPNGKKNGSRTSTDLIEHKHEMKAAGLVVRLMGLESMPTVQRDKHKKGSNSGKCDVKGDKFGHTQCQANEGVSSLDKGIVKFESRPQKLQKTEQFDERAVARFGAEALQIKNVLSRSKRHHHHHHKLASPVKSPRISSSRNVSRTSRLIDAATRILEPGLQASNRAKCTITYPSSMHYAPKNEAVIDALGLGVISPDLVHQPQNNLGFDMGVGECLTEQTSCKNCGSLLNVVDSRPTMEEEPFICPSSAVNSRHMYPSDSGRNEAKPFIHSPEQETYEIYRQNEVKLTSAAESLDSPLPCREPIFNMNHLYSESQAPRQFRGQHCILLKNGPSSVAFQQRAEAQNEMSVGRNRTSTAKFNNLQSRRASSAATAVGDKSVPMNRNSSGYTRPRLPARDNNYMADTEKKVCSRRDDSVRSPVRKRRTSSGNAQLERPGPLSSSSMRQKSITTDFVNGKELESNARTLIRSGNKTRSTNRAGNKSNEVVSFTFNSPMKHKNFMSSEGKEMIKHIDTASNERKLQSEGNSVKASLQRKCPLGGDTLGALLEQKLKELASQEEDEAANGGSGPKKSTALILQELISALTEQRPCSPDDNTFNAETGFQVQKGIEGSSVGLSHDGNRLSPGSVLEASFSNESCFSSSLEDNAGRRLVYDSVDCSCDQLRPTETDADLVDSATSFNGGRISSHLATDLVNHIAKILQSIHLADGGLTGSRLTHVKEVILNAELLFRSAASSNSERMKSSFIGPFLLNELETLAGALWTNFCCLLGFEESKEGSQLRRFLFNSVIEWLDTNYNRHRNSGFKAWRRIPSCMNTEILIEEVSEEVRRWNSFAGMILDQIIEWEMNHSLGKWTDFEIEAFETGCVISWEILQGIVDETVIDFCNCRSDSF